MKKIILILSMMMIIISSFGIAQYNSFWDGQNNYALGTTTLDDVIINPTKIIKMNNNYISSLDSWIILGNNLYYDNSWQYNGDTGMAVVVNSNNFLIYENDGSSLTTRFLLQKDGRVKSDKTYTHTVGATNRDIYVDNSGYYGYVSSSERYKKNIVNYDDNDWLYKLRPVKYDYIDEEKGINQVGLIAEEVEKVNPNIVSYNIVHNEEKDEYRKEIETVSYSQLITPLLKEVQRLNDRVAALEKELSKTSPVITEKIIIDQKIDYIEQPDFKKPIEEELGRSIEVKEVTKEEISIKK